MPHFRVDTLKAVGGWDPYNVTEDADLGFRLARAGHRTVTIASTTWEEAPIKFGSWLKQRTRWLKGWMQTYLVHTRPSRLRRSIGWRGWIGLHALMGGMLMSTLVHPLCLGIIMWQVLAGGGVLQPTAGPVERTLVWLAIVNLAVGYGSAMLAGAIASWRRRWRLLALQAVLMPLYWLLVSVAGYRALLQLFLAPHLWEKTAHGHSRAASSTASGP